MVQTEFATVSVKGQTTVPKSIRAMLGIDAGDQIEFRFDTTEEGVVTLRRAVEEHVDPVVGEFLQFLAKDMAMRPREIVPLTPELYDRMKGLAEGIEVDLDAPIDGDVAI